MKKNMHNYQKLWRPFKKEIIKSNLIHALGMILFTTREMKRFEN
jgi:hypothetical protein